MIKVIKHPKVEYLELLLESPDGVTAREVEEVYFDDVTQNVAGKALRRLHKRGCAKRLKEDSEYRYWITDKGIKKYYYLTKQT